MKKAILVFAIILSLLVPQRMDAASGLSVEFGTDYVLIFSEGRYIAGYGSANPTVRVSGTAGYVIPEGAFFFRTDLGAPITHTAGVWETTPRAVGALTATTSLTLGSSSPTAITNIRVYAPSLTPAASTAAIQTTEQTFTVTGLTTADKVFVNGPAPTSLCPPVTFRVSAANTLAIGFSTLTAAICTPAAGTYNIVAVRS